MTGIFDAFKHHLDTQNPRDGVRLVLKMHGASNEDHSEAVRSFFPGFLMSIDKKDRLAYLTKFMNAYHEGAEFNDLSSVYSEVFSGLVLCGEPELLKTLVKNSPDPSCLSKIFRAWPQKKHIEWEDHLDVFGAVWNNIPQKNKDDFHWSYIGPDDQASFYRALLVLAPPNDDQAWTGLVSLLIRHESVDRKLALELIERAQVDLNYVLSLAQTDPGPTPNPTLNQRQAFMFDGWADIQKLDQEKRGNVDRLEGVSTVRNFYCFLERLIEVLPAEKKILDPQYDLIFKQITSTNYAKKTHPNLFAFFEHAVLERETNAIAHAKPMGSAKKM